MAFIYYKSKSCFIRNAILILVLYGWLFLPEFVTAQESGEKENPRNQLMLIMSHSHITEGADENGGKKWIVVPSWALDYNYWLAKHWAIGLHTDMIIENFFIKEHGDEDKAIERTRPFALVPSVVFKPKEHSAFMVGTGAEFAKEENLVVTNFGYEYGWELPQHWELSASLTYDIKWNAYDTWILGIGISKFLGKH